MKTSVGDDDFYKEIIKGATITLIAEYFRNMPVNTQQVIYLTMNRK